MGGQQAGRAAREREGERKQRREVPLVRHPGREEGIGGAGEMTCEREVAHAVVAQRGDPVMGGKQHDEQRGDEQQNQKCGVIAQENHAVRREGGKAALCPWPRECGTAGSVCKPGREMIGGQNSLGNQRLFAYSAVSAVQQ
jgi:hypothetical protein